MVDEQSEVKQIPINNIKSNHLSKKQSYFDSNVKIDDEKMSPVGVAMRSVIVDQNNAQQQQSQSFLKSFAANRDNSIKHCVCGLPIKNGQETCDSCEGKNSVHIEGEIIKK